MNVEAECQVRIDLGGFDGAVHVSRSFGERFRVRIPYEVAAVGAE